jgi:toxin ParE1/3/4
MVTRARLPLIRRQRADLDIGEPLDHHVGMSASAAEGFVGAVERALAHIQRAPGTGSPRWAHELNIPGLRSWPCGRYPYIVFYMPLSDRIEIWRVLHGRRDIPAWLAEDKLRGAPPGKT